MDALKLFKFQLGILDDGGELDVLYQFKLDAARQQLKEQNGIDIDENNPHHLDVWIDLAIELVKVEKGDVAKSAMTARNSLYFSSQDEGGGVDEC